MLRDFRLHGITKYERSTLNEVAHQESLRFLMQGGRWGSDLQKVASPALLALKGATGKEHTVVRSFKLLPLNHNEDYFEYDSSWRPGPLSYIRRGQKSKVDRSGPSTKELKALQTAFDTFYEEQSLCLRSGIKISMVSRV